MRIDVYMKTGNVFQLVAKEELPVQSANFDCHADVRRIKRDLWDTIHHARNDGNPVDFGPDDNGNIVSVLPDQIAGFAVEPERKAST